MRRLGVLMAALAVCSLGTAAQQQPSFSTTTNLVVVPAIVFDRRGAPVAGPEANAFQLFEDGKPVPIEVFLPPGPEGAGVDGRFIVLVLDNLRTRAEVGWKVQEIARPFTNRMRTTDAVSVITMFNPNEASAFDDRGGDFSPFWLEAIRAAGENNVSVYAIDPESAPGRFNDDAGSFAGETGGYASVNTANYDAVVERIWRESGSYYLLGYRAPISDHRLHRIELKVTAPGLTVRARRVRDSAAQGGRSWGFFRTSAMQHAFSPQHPA